MCHGYLACAGDERHRSCSGMARMAMALAEEFGPGVPLLDPQTGSAHNLPSVSTIEPICVPIPAGDFLMGCDQIRDDERPAHRVWVDAFEMAIFQVRNRDFAVFIQATGHPAPPNWNQPGFDDPDHPVVAVSWVEALKYCQWLTG